MDFLKSMSLFHVKFNSRSIDMIKFGKIDFIFARHGTPHPMNEITCL